MPGHITHLNEHKQTDSAIISDELASAGRTKLMMNTTGWQVVNLSANPASTQLSTSSPGSQCAA